MTRTRRISALAAAAAALLAVGTGIWLHRDQATGANATAIPGLTPTWTTSGLEDAAHVGTGPAFPAALTGWKLTDEYDDGARVAGDWITLCTEDACEHRYPATMNGCASQRFLLRWRTTSGEKITFGRGVLADVFVIDEQLDDPSAAGWAELNGCGYPLWKNPTANGLTDIVVSVQQWTAAA